jgi:NADPH:quinone reductase-like Zn-dependent oxidoreductase
MKAAFFEKFGDPSVLKYGDLPDPVAAPGEVVVDVHAATVNAADWKFRAGQYPNAGTTKFPAIPGRDFCGVVAALGAGVDDLKVGDAVFGVLDAGREGTYCEKLAIKSALVGKKPDGLSHINAAALALTGLTAISAVADTLKLQRGETILVQGGAGGVASFAIQYAKHIGARVITTTSAANMAYVRSLGADEVIDYNAQDFTKVVLHRIRRPGAEVAAQRCGFAAASGRPLAGGDGAHRAGDYVGRGAPAGDQALQFSAGSRSAPAERVPALSGQARLSGALTGRPAARISAGWYRPARLGR